MDIEKAIEQLKLMKHYAERDMYKTSIYSSSEYAQKEIDTCDLAIEALEKQLIENKKEKCFD